jgi:hypothetical protein
LLCQTAGSGLIYDLVDSGAAVVSRFWSEPGSRFRFCHKSFLHKSWERELTRSFTGCAFVIMQTEDHKHGGEAANPSEERLDINALGVDSPRNKGDIVEAKFSGEGVQLGLWCSSPLGHRAI